MADEQAGWWLAAGLAKILLGMILLRTDDPFLLTLWGVALLIFGTVSIVVSTGVLLRMWR